MWLVEVLADSRGVLSYEGWKSIRKKVDKFGVRFGRLDCQLDIRYCSQFSYSSACKTYHIYSAIRQVFSPSIECLYITKSVRDQATERLGRNSLLSPFRIKLLPVLS